MPEKRLGETCTLTVGKFTAEFHEGATRIFSSGVGITHWGENTCVLSDDTNDQDIYDLSRLLEFVWLAGWCRWGEATHEARSPVVWAVPPRP